MAAVAVVMQDEDKASLLCDIVAELGGKVLRFPSGESLRTHLLYPSGRSIGLCILESALPGMSGPAVAWKLRSEGDGTPLICVLSPSPRWDDDDLLDCGFDAVLSHPLEPKSARKLIASLLGRMKPVFPIRMPTAKPMEKSISS